jgi:hypothetical protein
MTLWSVLASPALYRCCKLCALFVSRLERWLCSRRRMRTVRRRIHAAHLTACRGIIEQLEPVEIDAFPTAFVTLLFPALTLLSETFWSPHDLHLLFITLHVF